MTATNASRIKALQDELAAAKALAARVRDYWIPLPGHHTGDLVGVSVHTLDGTNWAIRHESILGMRAWTLDGWTPPMFVVARERAYCWDDLTKALAEAERVADILSRDGGTTVEELADGVQEVVDTVREAVAS